MVAVSTGASMGMPEIIESPLPYDTDETTRTTVTRGEGCKYSQSAPK
jgi:hypothetical protein